MRVALSACLLSLSFQLKMNGPLKSVPSVGYLVHEGEAPRTTLDGRKCTRLAHYQRRRKWNQSIMYEHIST
jgi:hypothetical protein